MLKKGIRFLDAPVAGSRSQAENAQLIFFVGGDISSFELAKPVLEAMGSVTHYAGSNGAGACLKLSVNALFGTQLATIAELLGLFKAAGLDVSHAVEILSSTPVCSPAAKMAASAMLAGNHAPMFPIDLVEKIFLTLRQLLKKMTYPYPLLAQTGAPLNTLKNEVLEMKILRV